MMNAGEFRSTDLSTVRIVNGSELALVRARIFASPGVIPKDTKLEIPG